MYLIRRQISLYKTNLYVKVFSPRCKEIIKKSNIEHVQCPRLSFMSAFAAMYVINGCSQTSLLHPSSPQPWDNLLYLRPHGEQTHIPTQWSD